MEKVGQVTYSQPQKKRRSSRSLKDLRAIEVNKYQHQYKHADGRPLKAPHRRKPYGMSDRRRGVALSHTDHWRGEGLIDVGCGRNEYIEAVKEAGNITGELTGVDPTPYLKKEGVVTAYGHELPFPDKCVDFATSWDVIAHLLPGDDTLLLRSLQRVARKAIGFSISSAPDNNVLHINVKTFKYWQQFVKDFFPDAIRIREYEFPKPPKRNGYPSIAPVWVEILER